MTPARKVPREPAWATAAGRRGRDPNQARPKDPKGGPAAERGVRTLVCCVMSVGLLHWPQGGLREEDLFFFLRCGGGICCSIFFFVLSRLSTPPELELVVGSHNVPSLRLPVLTSLVCPRRPRLSLSLPQPQPPLTTPGGTGAARPGGTPGTVVSLLLLLTCVCGLAAPHHLCTRVM